MTQPGALLRQYTTPSGAEGSPPLVVDFETVGERLSGRYAALGDGVDAVHPVGPVLVHACPPQGSASKDSKGSSRTEKKTDHACRAPIVTMRVED